MRQLPVAVNITEGNNIFGLLRDVRVVHCIVVTQITKLALNKRVCLHTVPIRILAWVPEQSNSVSVVLPLG